MQFNVRYLPHITQFHGEGSVFLNDTALIFEGGISKFEIPLIEPLESLFKKIIAVKTTRTVPYSTIVNDQKIKLSRNCYQIVYRLPDGTRAGIKFVVKRNKSNDGNDFFIKLEEYMTAIKNL